MRRRAKGTNGDGRTQKAGCSLAIRMRGYASVVSMVLVAAVAYAAEPGQPDLDITRAALEKWVQTRQLMSQEQHDWDLARQVLKDRIDLVEKEISALESKILDTENNITEADKKREDLIEENNAFKQSSSGLASMIIALEINTKKLLKRLPDPIRERVKPLSQRMPDDPRETKLSLSERFQNIIGILNEVNKFNREVTVTSEVRKLPDGTSAEVTALYLGIGFGYYVNPQADVAGVGTSTEEGWIWVADNKAAPQIAEAIAIMKNEKVASFVRLPVQIQ